MTTTTEAEALPAAAEKEPTPMWRGTLVVSHVVVATALAVAPLPVLDQMAKRFATRSMVRTLGRAHGVSFSDADVAILTDEMGRPPSPSKSKHLAVVLMIGRRYGRRWAAKLTGVLAARQALLVAGDLGCRGYLLDAALDEKLVAPRGAASADQVREAIDRVCDEVGTDPLRRGYEAARGLVRDFRSGPIEVVPVPEGAPSTSTGEGTLKARFRSALAEVRRDRRSKTNGQRDPRISPRR